MESRHVPHGLVPNIDHRGTLELPVPGRPATFVYSRARACCACSRYETGGLYFFLYFSSIFHF